MTEQENSSQTNGRPSLPIERGFPIEKVNAIAEKESRAGRWYRPVYTMHKWWSRKVGSLFRAITLYTLLDENTTKRDVEIYEPSENKTLGDIPKDIDNLVESINDVDMDNPDSLWDFYHKDIRIKDKKILDPFMGGGTSISESSRFGIDSVGIDLNPVAWFISKKQLDAGETTVGDLDSAFQKIKSDVEDEVKKYYVTPCPNGTHNADVIYNFWVKKIRCISCNHEIPLFRDYRVAKGRYENDGKYNTYCPECESITYTKNDGPESECNDCGNLFSHKEGNVTRGGYYNCSECGQKASITDAIEEQNGYDIQLYAVEYYCETCDNKGLNKNSYKAYKKAGQEDKQLFEDAKSEWKTRTDLHQYVPSEEIPVGHMTSERNPVFDHGYQEWTDMYNERQLLSLSKIVKSIDSISSSNLQEILLIALSNSLSTNNMMTPYDRNYNKIQHLFKTNSFDPTGTPCEGNVWGSEFGRGTFESVYDMVKAGVEYANAPTERYIEDNETKETSEFSQPIGQNTEVFQDDMRNIVSKNEYDVIITDPPYYDNIIYSEVSNFYYVWQKILLKEDYSCFDSEKVPQSESIVTNPFLQKTADDFEHEMGEALDVINQALKQDGTLAFTYHHSDEESWGELLQSLCAAGFEVTATYPINSELNKFVSGETVSFDIVIIARPIENCSPISWNTLRRHIVKTAKQTHETLEKERDLASGDIGVIEMGKCFQEYSKHHGEIRGTREGMTAKEVVDEIYGVIQDGDRGEQDIYLDLLEQNNPSYSDLNKHLKRSDASNETMKQMRLFRMQGNDFILISWEDEKRQAYIQNKIEEGGETITDLDKAHFLRYQYEHGKSRSEYLGQWETDELQELCEDIAAITDDETYLKMLSINTTLDEISGK